MSNGEVVKFATQFALAGFHVFPLFKNSSERGYTEPVGWNGNKPDDERSIPATRDVSKISSWLSMNLYGYGICGWNRFVIVDLDVKHGKNGVANFKVLRDKYNLNKPFLVVKTKSGGVHIFYKRSATLVDPVSKQVNYTYENVQYSGVDIFCDEGYVVGPTSVNEWKLGEYSIIAGSVVGELPEFPDALLEHMKTTKKVSTQASELADLYKEPSIKDQIRMGNLPKSIPCGERDSMLMTFIGFHKAKGLSKDALVVLVREFVNRCELEKGETRDQFIKALDCEGKIERIYSKQIDIGNPIELAKQLQPKVYKLTEEVPGKNVFIFVEETGLGIDLFVPKPAEQISQDFKKYERPVQISSDENVKPKIINPFTYLVNQWDNTVNTASFFGYKPSNEFVFDHSITGKKILNSYNPPFDGFTPTRIETEYIKQFEEFVQWLWGDDLFEFAMNWVAHLVQKPYVKMSVAPVLISQSHGVGKNVFVYNVANMLGMQNFSNASMNVVLDKHFSMVDKVLIQINEVAAHHATQRHILVQFMSKLKDLVTEYSLTINPKFKSERDVPFFGNFILCTNSLTSIMVELEDRRLMINHILHQNLDPKFSRVAALVKDQTVSTQERMNVFYALRQHFLEFKMTMDLSNYRAPMTNQKEEMMLNSMSPSHAMMYEYFKDPENPGVKHDIVSGDLLLYIARKLGISEVERKAYLVKSLLEQHMIEPIRVLPSNSNPKDTRKFTMVPQFDPDHEIIVFPADKYAAKKQLYTIRNHRTYNIHNNDAILGFLLANIQSLVQQRTSADIVSMIKSA